MKKVVTVLFVLLVCMGNVNATLALATPENNNGNPFPAETEPAGTVLSAAIAGANFSLQGHEALNQFYRLISQIPRTNESAFQDTLVSKSTSAFNDLSPFKNDPSFIGVLPGEETLRLPKDPILSNEEYKKSQYYVPNSEARNGIHLSVAEDNKSLYDERVA